MATKQTKAIKKESLLHLKDVISARLADILLKLETREKQPEGILMAATAIDSQAMLDSVEAGRALALVEVLQMIEWEEENQKK